MNEEWVFDCVGISADFLMPRLAEHCHGSYPKNLHPSLSHSKTLHSLCIQANSYAQRRSLNN